MLAGCDRLHRWLADRWRSHGRIDPKRQGHAVGMTLETQYTVSVTSALDFQAGHVIFEDGSRRAVELSLRSSDGGGYVYALTLGAP